MEHVESYRDLEVYKIACQLQWESYKNIFIKVLTVSISFVLRCQ